MEFGKIDNIEQDEIAIWYTIATNEGIIKYIVEKGSVAIEGVSLTVAKVKENKFKVSIIPHTQEETNLKYKKKNDIVNIECDIIGKYIEKFINKESKSELTKEFLIECGF